MKGNKVIAGLLIGIPFLYGIGYVYNQKRLTDNIKYTVDKNSFRLNSITGEAISFSFVLTIKNPSDFDFSITSYSFDVWWNNKPFTELHSMGEVLTIPAHSFVNVPITVAADPRQAAINTVTAFIRPDAGRTVGLFGHINIAINKIFFIRQPVNETFKL